MKEKGESVKVRYKRQDTITKQIPIPKFEYPNFSGFASLVFDNWLLVIV
jgi:hypothetical protein